MAAPVPVWAKETVRLRNGFQMEADSHTREGDVVTLRLATGTVALQIGEIEAIEFTPEAAVVKVASAEIAKSKPEEALAKAGAAQGLPLEFVLSVAKVESGMHQDAVSPKGALGLMQLMPGTASVLGVNPAIAEENAQGGALYLRQLLLRYKCDAALTLAAYNAGPGAVAKYGGVPPYSETRKYINRVLSEYDRQQKRQQATRKTASAALDSPVRSPANMPTATN